MVLPRSKEKLSENERLQRDVRIMEKLKIFHKPETTSNGWPQHLKTTFSKVESLGCVRFESFLETEGDRPGRAFWRREIKNRARELSETASRLLNENPSEMTWRLALEHLVFARFHKVTEWLVIAHFTIQIGLVVDYDSSVCKGRLWRSEEEAMAEVEGPLSASLNSRRRFRTPCKCEVPASLGLNPLFSSRADEFICHNYLLTFDIEPSEFPKRKPDLVYGLRQTPNFLDKLSKSAKFLQDGVKADILKSVAEALQVEVAHLLIRDVLITTPHQTIGEPLLFPFLVAEAKSNDGSGFHKAGIQSAVPCCVLLEGQERLQHCTKPFLELGGAVVWYVAYRGEEWRVSGAFVLPESGENTYVSANEPPSPIG